MQTERWLMGLAALNGVLLIALAASLVSPVRAGVEAPAVIKARAFHLVDEEGRVRASLAVMPPQRQANGETSPETVLLRLITERGRPSVKLSATESGSGIALSGPTGTSNTYMILESGDATSSLRLKNEDGREQTIRP